MPELADVEGFRRVFAEDAVDTPVTEVTVLDRQVLRGFTPQTLRNMLCGNSFDQPFRHGKFLIAPVRETGSYLVLHFGMTGELLWSSADQQRHDHDRVVIGFADGELRYRDMRKLRGLYRSADDGELAQQLATLGPDACAISAADLTSRIRQRNRQLKSALADQSTIAGLGNLLIDEILWQAGIQPRARGNDIAEHELTKLHSTMRTVLRQAAGVGRVPEWASWLTGHRDEPHGRCPRCGTELRQARVNSRATVWCPHCQ